MGVQAILEVITGIRFSAFSSSFRRRWLLIEATDNEFYKLVERMARDKIARRTRAMLLFRLKLSQHVKTVMCEDIMVLLYKQQQHCPTPRVLYNRIMRHIHERIRSVPFRLLRRYYIFIDKLHIRLPLSKDRAIRSEEYPSGSQVTERGVVLAAPDGIAPLDVPRILKNPKLAEQLMQILIAYQAQDTRYHDVPIGWCHGGGTFHVDQGHITSVPSESWEIREGDLQSRILLSYAATDACVSWTLDSDQLPILLPIAPYFVHGLFWGTEYCDENAQALYKQRAVNEMRRRSVMKTVFKEMPDTVLDWVRQSETGLEAPAAFADDEKMEAKSGLQPMHSRLPCCVEEPPVQPKSGTAALIPRADEVEALSLPIDDGCTKVPQLMFRETIPLKPPLMFNMREFYRALDRDGMSPEGFVTFTMMNGWDYQPHNKLFPRVNGIDVYNAVKDVLNDHGNPYLIKEDYIRIVEYAWSRHKKLERMHMYKELREKCIGIPSMDEILDAYQLFRIGYPYWRTFHNTCPEAARDDLFMNPSRHPLILEQRRKWLDQSVPYPPLTNQSTHVANRNIESPGKRKSESVETNFTQTENPWKRQRLASLATASTTQPALDQDA
jgi:hypothetical protein